MYAPTRDEISKAYHEGPEAIIELYKTMCESAMEDLARDPKSAELLNNLFDEMEDDGKTARNLWDNPKTRLDAIDAIERHIDEKKRTIEELKAKEKRLKTELENQRIKAAMDSWRQGIRR